MQKKVEVIITGPYDSSTLFAFVDDPQSIKDLERDLKALLKKNVRYAAMEQRDVKE